MLADTVYIDNLKDDIRSLRRGFEKKMAKSNTLRVSMGCQSADIQQSTSFFLTLVKLFVDDPCDAEILLAAMGLLKGYEKIKQIGERRRKYYENGYPERRWGNPTEMLRNIEDNAIEMLANKIANTSNLPVILAKAPLITELPTPQYYRKNQAADTSKHQYGNQVITIKDDDGVYVGEYLIDDKTGQALRHGRGKLTLNNGSSYEGEFVRNVRQGKGTLTDSDGVIRSALWKDNMMFGAVEIKTSEGRYFGYANGENACIERIEFLTGYLFEGVVNEHHAKGKLIHPDKRFGYFYSDQTHGLRIQSGDEDIRKEIVKFPFALVKQIYLGEGLIYKGELRDDIPHGYGQYIYPNKMIFEAKSDMGAISRGTWIFPSGHTLDCVWNDNSWHGEKVEDGIFGKVEISPEGKVLAVSLEDLDIEEAEKIAQLLRGD